MEAVRYDSTFIGGEEFKGKFYLMLGSTDTVVYNTIQVNQAERVAKSMEKIIGLGIKDVSEIFKIKGIDGVKIELKLFFRDFLREYTPSSEDLHVYFLLSDLSEYKNADITNQQLVDKSFVLVNGNRVQVSLTQFK